MLFRSGLSEVADRHVAGILALAAAASAAIGTALAGGTRASTAEVAASADIALVDAARTFHLTVAPYVTLNDAVEGFDKLCKQRDEVVAAMPMTHLPTGRRRFRRLWQEAKGNQDRRLSEVAAALDRSPSAPT